jgi:hypothetical protein
MGDPREPSTHVGPVIDALSRLRPISGPGVVVILGSIRLPSLASRQPDVGGPYPLELMGTPRVSAFNDLDREMPSKGLPAMAGPSLILLPAKRIELVTKVICALGIGGAAWKEHVSSRLHTNVHERGLNFQIRFR